MTPHAADTIAAVATPAGEGALAVIRISGPKAFVVADRVFRGRHSLGTVEGYTVHVGHFVDGAGEQIDNGLATVFRAPRSYTGEDAVEFSCHGGIFVTGAVLDAVIASGARHAQPGEFTRRAFLNGKLDLSQAEAVAALIAARSDRARRASLEQLRGKLGRTVRELRESMLRLCALLELDLDFSEEGIDLVSRQTIGMQLEQTADRLDRIAETFSAGRLSRDGLTVVIAGEPNSGKSTLFNSLLKESRAIVTAVPGTTRDFLEESISVEGVLMRLIDTAGLRMSDDLVEREGIYRSHASIERGDVILLVEVAGRDEAETEQLVNELQLSGHQTLILVRNKIDSAPGIAGGRGIVSAGGRDVTEVRLSAKTGEGIPLLRDAILHSASSAGETSIGSVEVINRRHWQLLTHASTDLKHALSALSTGATNEFIAFDVREAAKMLGEITGEVSSEDILNTIFAAFCIGK